MTDEEYAKNYGTEKFFTEGNWEIHGNPLQHPRLNPAVSRVVHFCDNPYKYERGMSSSDKYCHVWSHLRGNRACPACGELMPDSVQTLWTLQNFDVDFDRLAK